MEWKDEETKTDKKQMQELLKTELEKQKLQKAELERLERQKIMAYGNETRSSDHKAIMQEMARMQQAKERGKIYAQELIQQASEKRERQRNDGMSLKEQSWQQSYLEQLRQKEEQINRELNVNVKLVANGRKRGMAF